MGISGRTHLALNSGIKKILLPLDGRGVCFTYYIIDDKANE
jgi:hypothetical protein